MSSLSPLSMSSLLGAHSNVLKQAMPYTPPPKMVRKHYSDHDSHNDHQEEHHYSKKKKSRSIAMTALTLLAFLFFLHILQQCLHDQVETTTVAPTTIVMQANIQTAKEGAHNLPKESGHRYTKDNMKESQIRAASDEMEVTTSYSSEERKILQESSKEGSSFYQYDKVHVPVKMKMVEKPHKIKRL